MYLLMILVGFVLIVLAFEGKSKNDNIFKNGLKSTATVIGQTKTKNEKPYRSHQQNYKEYTYWPVYEFTTNKNEKITVNGKVGGLRVTMGETSDIYYNPRNPASGFIVVQDNWVDYIGIIAGGLFIVAGSLLFYFN